MKQQIIAKGTVVVNDRYCYLEIEELINGDAVWAHTEKRHLLLGGWAAHYEGEQLTIIKESEEPLPFADFIEAELPALEYA